MKISVIAAISALAASSAALAQTTPSGPAGTRSDQHPATTAPAGGHYSDTAASDSKGGKLTSAEFVKKAATDGLAEVEMGKMGAMKATSPDVKSFAQRMVTDHTKANNELATAAKGKGLEVPTAPDMKQKAMMKKFDMQKSDKDFDQDFMEHMVKDHEDAVKLFQTASTDTNIDPALRALATKTLPTLQDHLKQAQMIQAKVGK